MGVQILFLQLPFDLTIVAQGKCHLSSKMIRGLVRARLIMCLSTSWGVGTTGRLKIGA